MHAMCVLSQYSHRPNCDKSVGYPNIITFYPQKKNVSFIIRLNYSKLPALYFRLWSTLPNTYITTFMFSLGNQILATIFWGLILN